MPIEIKELHIRVAVNAAPGAATARGAGGEEGARATDDLVAQCVEQVLQVLHNKMER